MQASVAYIDLNSIATMLGALAAVIGLVGLLAWLARARGFGAAAPSSGFLVVEARVPLDPERTLSLVRCGDRRVLLLSGGGNDIVVGWLPEQPAR